VEKVLCEVNSWSTCDDLCRQTLESLEISEKNGWTLDLSIINEENSENICELMSCDYLFDVISEIESDPESKGFHRVLPKINYMIGRRREAACTESIRQLEEIADRLYGSSVNNSVGSITSLIRSKASNSLRSDQTNKNDSNRLEENYSETIYDVNENCGENEINSSFYDGEDMEVQNIGYKNTEKLLNELNQNLQSANKSVCFRFEPTNSTIEVVTLKKTEESNQTNENQDNRTETKTVQKTSKFENTKKLLKATLSKCSKLNTRYVKKPTCLHSSSRGSVTRKNKNRIAKLKNSSTSSGSLRSKRSKNKRKPKFSGCNSKEKIEIEMALRMKEETIKLSEMNKIIQSIPIPRNKQDLDHFLDSLFDHALESNSNMKKNMIKQSDQEYEQFINSIGNRYSLKFSSKFNENDDNMNLSARIKGGPTQSGSSIPTPTTTTKTSSTFIKIYKNGPDTKRQSNIEKKSVVKLVKGPLKTFTTFIPVPIRKTKIAEEMVK
jgi:hypothetical protein